MANKTTKICLRGKFTFDSRQEFHAAANAALSDVQANNILVDLSAVNYVDSSAIGLLLILKDKAVTVNKTVSLTGATGTVAELFKLINLDRMFLLT